MRAHDGVIDELSLICVAVETALDVEDLLDVEADTVGVQLAVFVVHMDRSSSDFIRQEHILVEDRSHGRRSLVDAAPRLDVAGLSLGFANFQLFRPLTDREHLLVLHAIFLVGSPKGRLDVVLDLSLGLLTLAVVLEVQGRGDTVWQLGLECDLVDARLEHAVDDIKDLIFELEESLAVLQLLVTVHGSVTVLLGPMADEGALLTTFDLQQDVRGLNSFHDLHVDNTIDSVAWLIEGVLRLELDLTLGEFTPTVGEEQGHVNTLIF